MESENQLNGGVIRYISQMFAVLRRLYYKLLSLPPAQSRHFKQNVRPSAGDQHVRSTWDVNLLSRRGARALTRQRRPRHISTERSHGDADVNRKCFSHNASAHVKVHWLFLE